MISDFILGTLVVFMIVKPIFNAHKIRKIEERLNK